MKSGEEGEESGGESREAARARGGSRLRVLREGKERRNKRAQWARRPSSHSTAMSTYVYPMGMEP